MFDLQLASNSAHSPLSLSLSLTPPRLCTTIFKVMTRLKMKLPVILILLSGLASLTMANNGPSFCDHLEQHHYKSIGLQSLTWDNYLEGLLIFTWPENRYYSLPRGKLTRNSIDLSEARPEDITEKGEYKTAIREAKNTQGTVKGTYMFYLWKYTGVPAWSYKHIALVATERGALTGNFKDDRAEEVTHPDGAEVPDFSLASIGYYGPVLSGYVLFSDSGRFPGIVLLGQFNVSYEGSKVTGLPLRSGQTEARPFFTLEVTSHPFEVYLVPSSNHPDPEAQLLNSVPRSFFYDGKHLVLFDTVNGCVHLILDLGEFNVGATEPRTFKRENYPFEVYFKCGKQLENPNPNRCNVIKGSHRPTGLTPENWETPSTEGGVGFSKGATTSICLLVALLAVGLLYAIVAKKKGQQAKGKSASGVKSSNGSSSGISGTSKPASSKSTAGKSSISSGNGAKSKTTPK